MHWPKLYQFLELLPGERRLLARLYLARAERGRFHLKAASGLVTVETTVSASDSMTPMWPSLAVIMERWYKLADMAVLREQVTCSDRH
jgi:hypothetical protein